MAVHLDCQSLLTKLQLHQDCQYFNPHEAISSEHHVLMQIETLLDVLTVYFAFRFVKGHKDNNKAMHKLDSPALTNIHADSLASSALSSAKPSPDVLFFPASICHPSRELAR